METFRVSSRATPPIPRSAAVLAGLLLIACCMGRLSPQAAAQVPVTFTLDQPGYVTLVVEDEAGRRIRNLIQETRFEAGTHTIYWDGYDEGERVTVLQEGTKKPARHYDIHRHLVAPGRYRVRGLIHDGMEMRYQMSVQSPGSPPWHTPDTSGAWLSDHGTPASALSLPNGSPHSREPQVLIGSPIAETGHGVMWLNLAGRKLSGAKVQGWQGALTLTDDPGPQTNSRYYAYSAAERRRKLHIHGIRADAAGGDAFEQVTVIDLPGYERLDLTMVDLAAFNGVLLLSQPKENQVLLLDTQRKGQEIGRVTIDSPRGMTFDRSGGLYLLSGQKLMHYARPDLKNGQLGSARLVSGDLQDPRRLTLGPDATIYVSDWGERHQVVAFAPDGKRLRTIGKPGGPQLGRYDEQRMHHPAGLAIDAEGKLWVAEADYSPKRISQWSTSGEFRHADYGPPKYGGGGFVDPLDPTRFYYSSGLQGIEFHLDWETGKSRPASIYYLRREDDVGATTPDFPIHLNGRQYMANCFSVRPFGWKATDASVFLMDRDRGTVEHLARVGQLQSFLQAAAETDPALAARLIPDKQPPKFNFYAWSDLNRDGTPQADEVQAYAIRDETMSGRAHGGISIGRDMSISATSGLYVPPPTITADGVPVWDLEKVQLMTDAGAYQADVIQTRDGFTILTAGPIVGYREGQLVWSYHSQWPRRGGPAAPPPGYPGQLVGTSRIIGDSIVPGGGEAGEVWAINSDKGMIYLLTSDGLFLTELGGDLRITPPMQMPQWERGMVLPRVSFNDEHFWPSVTQMTDGRVLFAIGKEHSSIFELKGLETARRLAAPDVGVETAMLAGKPEIQVEPGAVRTEKRWRVTAASSPPGLTGRMADWSSADWQTIDSRRNVRAAIQVHDEVLYVAYEAADEQLLRNNLPDGWEHAFATGGGFDLMVRTQPKEAAPQRGSRHRAAETAMAGDVRIVITRNSQEAEAPVVAVRYEQEREAGPDHPVEYVSPIGRVQFDSVTDVSRQVRLAQHGGLYEIAIPLSALGLRVEPGMETLGDVGILVGDGRDTYARLYWNNRQSGMTTDIPSEARLTPEAWGTWVFETKE